MRTEVLAYPPPWRTVAVVLMTLSRLAAIAILVVLLLFDTPLANPLRLARVFFSLSFAPGLAAWLIGRAFAGVAEIEAGVLSLQQRGRRIEIRLDAIEGVAAWRLPLPAGGLWLRLKSGRRYGLQVGDPIAFAEALAGAGGPADVASATHHPTAAYARAKCDPARRWFHPLLEFVVFGLVPTLPLFRLHQWIAYGGTFGEYYTYGLAAYLASFAIHWVTLIIYLLLYAAVLRLVLESIALAGAWIAPAGAGRLRRLLRFAYRLLYFGGVPALLAVRFLAG